MEMEGGGERWGGRGGGRGERSREGGRVVEGGKVVFSKELEGGTLVSMEGGAGLGEGCRAEQARDLGKSFKKSITNRAK